MPSGPTRASNLLQEYIDAQKDAEMDTQVERLAEFMKLNPVATYVKLRARGFTGEELEHGVKRKWLRRSGGDMMSDGQLKPIVYHFCPPDRPSVKSVEDS